MNTTKNIILAILTGVFFAFVISAITGLVINQRFASIELDGDKLNIEPSPTKIYDANGNIMAEFEKDGKEMTPYSQIPVEIIEGVVSTEDREFFKHAGLNVRAIFRAVIVDLAAGSFEQGGSTVTQQLAKRVYLDPGKTIERKIKEVVYSTAIEKEFSKQDIMAYYLNHIYYGYGAYGIENAIWTYFGQTIEEFQAQDEIDKIAKSAFLAGVPQAPSYLDPYINPEPAMNRRNTVLTNMYTEGYITREQYEAAREKGFLVLEEPNRSSTTSTITNSEFVHYVLSEAGEKLDMSVEEVMYSGATIYTSFMPEVYEAIRTHLSNGKLYPSNPANDSQIVQGAAVLVNPQNGEIYAMSGSRTDIEFLGFNRAFQAYRQPGSTFKPLIAYGPALETGKYSPYSSVSCSPNFRNYSVKDRSCSGKKSIAEAIRISNNVPAVNMLNSVGIDYARDYVAKLGIELTENDVYLPIALGGIEKGVTPLQLADAYQVYANGGKRAEAHTIRRIVNKSGEIIFEPEEPQQVINEKAANQMKSMLQAVVSSGTGTKGKVKGYRVGGKTGTNENASGTGNNDIWFAGFTDNLVGVVWMGFDNSDSRHYIRNGEGSGITATMFSKIATDVLKLLPRLEYKEENIEKITIDLFRNTEANEVTIKWNARSGEKYEVYRNNTLIGGSLDGSYTDRNCESGQTYTYKVIGYDDETGRRVVESKETSIKLPTVQVKPEKEEEEEEEKVEESKEETEKKEDNSAAEPEKEESASDKKEEDTPTSETTPETEEKDEVSPLSEETEEGKQP